MRSPRTPVRHPSAPRRRDIQGLRALAVGLVVAFHAGVPRLTGGYVGVDVFFVISGFLITGHLARRPEGPVLGFLVGFYGRRILRLLPMATVALVVTMIAVRAIASPLVYSEARKSGIATALYAVNFRLAHQGTQYLNDATPSVFQQFWSLAVEEQFYAVWPILLIGAAALWATSTRRLTVVLGLVSAVSFVGCVFLTRHDQPWAFFLFPTRVWEFGLGGMIAVAAPRFRPWPRWVSESCAAIGVVAVVAAAVVFDERTNFPGWAALLPCLGCAAVIVAGRADGTGTLSGRLLGVAPMVWVGGISYSLYLWHWPVLVVPAIGTAGGLSGWQRVALVVLTIVLAALSTRFIEDPLRRNRILRARPVRPFVLAAVATIVSLAVVVGLSSPARVTASQAVASWPGDALPAAAPTPTTVGSNVVPGLRNALYDLPSIPSGCLVDYGVVEAKTCEFGPTTAPRTMMLVGDSHAEQWFDPVRAAASAEGMRLVTLLKVSCSPLPISMFNGRLSRAYTECDRWRRAAVAKIAAVAPDVVVIAHFDGAEFADADAPRGSTWSHGATSFLGSLPAGTRVLYVGDNPLWAAPPALCLSVHVHDADACSQPVGAVVDTDAHAEELAAATAGGAVVLDMTQFLCPQDRCPVLFWNVLGYRDLNHVSGRLAEHLAPAFDQAVQRALTG